MALKNLTSDLSDYFRKEPSKPTGRFQQPDRTMSELDVHGKLETYKTPEIQKDASGQPIIPTDFKLPDGKTRYTDNFESKLIKLASVDVTQTTLEGRFETSPVTISEIAKSGRNEESRYDVEPTNPKGRNEVSNVVIPEIDPTGRFTVSGVDPALSVLKGRFETSDIEPVQSILNGRHAETDNAGIEITPGNSPIEINNTTFQVYDDSEVEVKPLYNYGQSVNFDGSLVNINIPDESLQERAIKAPGALPFTTTLGQPFSLIGTNIFAPGYSNIETRINFTDEQNVMTFGSNGGGLETQFSNIVADAHINPGSSTDPNYHGALDLPVPQQPIFSTIATGFDKTLNTYVNEIGIGTVVDPQTFEINLYADQIGTKGSFAADGTYQPGDLTQTYMDLLEPFDLDYTIPFNAGDPNSVMAAYGYDIIEMIPNFTSPNGQMYTIQPTANSPFGSVMVTGMHTGIMEQYNPSFFDQTVSGLDMVQTFTVEAQDSIVPINEVTITGGKNSFDQSTLDNSQTISTSLFGGKTYQQIGVLATTDTISLEDQISVGMNVLGDDYAVGFTPNMTQTFSPAGDEGSKYIGIDDGTYTRPGISNTYSHAAVYQAAYGTESNPGLAVTGTPTAIAYDENNHLTPGTYRQFTVNQSGPINYITDQDGVFNFTTEENAARLSRQPGGRYVHRLGPYGLDTTVTTKLPGENIREDLPILYNDGTGAAQYAVPVGDKPTAYNINHQDNIIDVGVRYGDFIVDKIRSGDEEEWYESAFPAFSGKNISTAKVGVDQLSKMMKRKKTYRIWETHNSYTRQGNKGLHKGLEHYGVVSGGSSLTDGWFPELTNIAQAGNTTANRYYSVLGYPGLMVAWGLANSGAVAHVDFRSLINDPLAVFYGDSTISNYQSNSLVARGGSYNQGRPGLARRDYRNAVTKSKPYGGDAITQQSITGTDIKALEQEYGDLIKFYIKDPIKGNTLRFRSYITAINDSLGATWTGIKYIGRPNNLFLYEGASDRKLSFNLKVAALSRYDVIQMWRKVNYLMSLCYPHVNESTGQMVGPVVGLTLGDWFQDEPGFFDSVNITVDTSSPWEVNFEDQRFNAGNIGEQLLDSALKGGLKGAINTGLNKIKDTVKGKVLNQSIDDKGQQVAQLPQVIDITLGFTSMATANRTVGGDMFGCWDENGAWRNGDPGFPKPSALDRLMGGDAGKFAGSKVGKALGGILGRR